MRQTAMKRTVVIFAPLLIGALALSGCSKKKSTTGSSKATYTIGYQGPLSGDNAQLGINMDNGVKLAIEQANATGTLPFTLAFADSDDVGDPSKSPAAAQKLIDQSNLVAVVGPAFSGATAAAEPKFSDASLISVSPSATRADLTHSGFKTFYRVVTGDTIQGAQMADYVAKVLKSKSAYLIDDKSAYGAGLLKFVKAELTTNGVTIGSESIAPTKVYSTIATKAVSSKADTIVYGGYYAELALLAKALKTAGFTGNLISGDGSKDDQLVKQGGTAAEGIYLTCPCGSTTKSTAQTKFDTDYKAKFGVDSGTYSAEAYDATNTIIAAMKTLTGTITRDALAAAFKGITFEGITHSIKFDADGEGGTGDIFAFQVKSGKIEQLGKISDLAK